MLMSTHGELGEGISALAKRSVGLKKACGNEESTKLYLVLPLIGLLGYDYTDPYEVYPEHTATADADHSHKVDFAILREGRPVIAIECRKAGADLADARGHLRAYYNASPTTKLAVLTNGMLFEFFVDASDPNRMDEEPFLTVDLENVARNGASAEVLQALTLLTKANFDPPMVAELAHVELVKRRLRTALAEEAKMPSEDFCRLFLQKAGLKSVRKDAIERHYALIVKAAFEEAVLLPVVQRLRGEPNSKHGKGGLPPLVEQRVVTTERELAIVNYVRRRLAYLVDEETFFNAIERVDYKDYVGKLVVYFNKERNGRLFDYIEGADGFDTFVFPEPHGKIVTNNILDIDEPLHAIFTFRVREFGLLEPLARLAQIA
jgi:hypothetical protein